jgi:hypothetical protein
MFSAEFADERTMPIAMRVDRGKRHHRLSARVTVPRVCFW